MNAHLKDNAEFNELVETALNDYALWFTDDDTDESRQLLHEIENALQGDYWNCAVLPDALSAWRTNLVDLIEGTTNQDDINIAQDQIKLIDQYFA